MKIGIVVFPGSNCDNDLFYAFEKQKMYDVIFLWHKDCLLYTSDAADES